MPDAAETNRGTGKQSYRMIRTIKVGDEYNPPSRHILSTYRPCVGLNNFSYLSPKYCSSTISTDY